MYDCKNICLTLITIFITLINRLYVFSIKTPLTRPD